MHRTMNVHARPDTPVNGQVHDNDGLPPYATVTVGPNMDDLTLFAWDPEWLRKLASAALAAAVGLEAVQPENGRVPA